ncbi:MAG: HAD hydrolase-like protein [Alphaproteobacteria bacterium]
MTKTPPTMIYDLDGTLVDTAPDLLHTLNLTLADRGYRTVDPNDVADFVGQGAKAMLGRAFTKLGVVTQEEEVDEMFRSFLGHYEANLTQKGSAPYPGVVPVLEAYQAAGGAQGVCTNKFESGAVKLLGNLNLSHFFGAIVGGDTLAVRKPDAEHVLETIRRVGGDPANSIMVGDSANDSLAAKAAGIPCVLVDFGYTAVPARELGADKVISHFGNLPDAVAEITGFAL